MTIRPLLIAPDPKLRQKSAPVAAVDDDTRRLMDDMLETMYDASGIGLAAIQIGVPERIIVMDISDDESPPEPRHFVNPEILDPSDQVQPHEEGCLSLPDIYEEVTRPDRCRVRFMDYHGAAHDIICEGLLAVCIQHEMDHLEGILFIDRLSRLKRDMSLKKLAKAARLKEPA